MTPRRFPRPALLLTAALFLPACASPSYDDPIAVMSSRSNDPDAQMAAARQAEQRFPDDPRRIAALNSMLWDRGYSAQQRRYAVDQLIAHDEAQFRKDLARRIVLIQSWDTIDYIFAKAVERRWTDFTPVVVRNYAREAKGYTDADRPERAVIEKLNPGKSVDEVIFEVFADADDKVPIEQQVAAWELLNRLTDSEKLIALLHTAPDSTPLVVDLKAAADELHVTPRNKEGVLWLTYLRDPTRRPYWDSLKAAVAKLSDEQRQGLQLRHLEVLLRLDERTLKSSRSALMSEVGGAVMNAEHHLVGPTFDGPMNDWPQEFHDWADKLSWGDLAAVKLIMSAVRDPGVQSELFRQAEADHEDKTTEYGGVLDAKDGGKFTAKLFVPRMRRHDLIFLPDNAMIEELYTALAHYHFHAQEYKNSSYAGPGLGDLKTADRLNFNFVVFTFIDRDTLNVDYYQPGKAVLDIGTIHR